MSVPNRIFLPFYAWHDQSRIGGPVLKAGHALVAAGGGRPEPRMASPPFG